MLNITRRAYIRGAGLAALLLLLAVILVANMGTVAATPVFVNFLPIAQKSLPPPAGPFPAAADTTILQGYATHNFGGAPDMWAGYDDFLDPDGQIVRSLVYFDLSGIPLGTQIVSSSLHLQLVSSWDFPNHTRTITTYRVTQGWSEPNVTWNTAPAHAEAYGSAGVKHGAWDWYAFDVTALVQAWLDGTHVNHGIMLRGPEHSGPDSSWKAFSTREGDYPPELKISYVGPTGEVVTVTLTDAPAIEGDARIEPILQTDLPQCREGQSDKCLAKR
jgi:hypothetical protein